MQGTGLKIQLSSWDHMAATKMNGQLNPLKGNLLVGADKGLMLDIKTGSLQGL